MFCPKCGQERLTIETSFCSRCGFLLTGTAEILQLGGSLPGVSSEKLYKPPSPRSRGIKQGLFIFLLSFLIVPLITAFLMMLRAGPELAMVATLLLVMGGVLRMAYAWMFESPIPQGWETQAVLSSAQPLHNRPPNGQLPSKQAYPVPSYFAAAPGNWRDTNDLQPTSVAEGTTRQLGRDET